MQLHPAHVTDFSGGLNTGAPLVGFPQNQFPDAVNADALVNGRLARRLGTRRTHASRLTSGGGSTQSSQAIGAAVWWPGGTRQRVVIFHTSVYYSDDDGASWTSAATLTNPSSGWEFVTVRVSGQDWLYVAGNDNNNPDVYRWDGSSVWEVAPGVPSGVNNLAVFNRRLYVAGHDGPNVQASAIGDPEDFTVPNGLVLPVYTDTGDTAIRGLYQLGPILLVFHRDATSYISGVGRSDLIVATGATGMSKSIGCLSVHTVRDVGSNSAIWLSPRGFELYDGATIRQISSPQLDDVLDAESLRLIESAQNPTYANAIYLTDRELYWCSFLSRVNRPVLGKFDRRTGAWTIHEFEMRDDLGSFALGLLPIGILVGAPSSQLSDDQITRPEAFAWDGFYRDIEIGDNDDADVDLSNGLPIELRARLQPFIFRSLPNRKRARQIRPNAETKQPEATVYVSAISDGKEAGRANQAVNPGFETGSSAPWNLAGGGGTWTVTTTNPRKGSFALQFDAAGQTAIASADTTIADAGSAPAANEGDFWEFLVWCRTEAQTTLVRTGVVYRDVTNNVVGERFTPFEVARIDASYSTDLLIDARAPAGTVYVQGRIEVVVDAVTPTGRVWLDDARLRRLSRKALTIETSDGDIPRQPIKARVNGRGRVQQVGIYTTDRVEIVAVEERAEMLRET